MSTVGIVQRIARYPVKSMRGEELSKAEFTFQGMRGDRLYTFVQEGVHNTFPFLTGRECPDLLKYQPEWQHGDPRPRLMVRTPDGALLPVESDELRAEIERRAGRAVRLHSDHRGNHDVAYVSIITTATVEALARAGGVVPDHRRFRMNLVVQTEGIPFGEAGWVGRVVRIGGVRLAVTEQDRRCQMITLDPETGVSAPAVLKQAGGLNGACAGVYASVLSLGSVEVGEAVVVEG